MAITIETAPNGVYLSRNAIPLKVKHVDDQGLTPAYAGHFLYIPATDTPVWQIGWRHDGIEYIEWFEFVASPDNSGIQRPIPADWGSPYTDPQILIDAVAGHPVMSQFFYAEQAAAPSLVNLIATVWGVEFFAVPDAVSISLITLDAEVRTIPKVPISAKFLIEEVDGSDEYTLIKEAIYSMFLTTESLVPPALGAEEYFNSEILIDVHHFFEPHLRHHTMTETIWPTWYEIETNKRCKITVSEYINATTYGDSETTDTFRVIHGGLNKIDLPKFFLSPEGSWFLHTWSKVSKHFLTYRPHIREITPDMLISLFWLCHADPSQNFEFNEQYRLEGKVFYTDGSTTTTSINDYNNYRKEKTYRLNVGFDQNSLNALNPTKTPYKYQVALKSLNTDTGTVGLPVSGTVEFWLRSPHYLHLYVFWLNSFGVEECSLFEGERKVLSKIDKDFAETYHQSQPGLMSVVDANVFNNRESSIAYRQSQLNTLTLETGAISKEELMAHADMLRSTYVYVQRPGQTERTTLRVTPGSFEIGYKNQNGEHVNGVRFNAEVEDNQNFSLINLQW